MLWRVIKDFPEILRDQLARERAGTINPYLHGQPPEVWSHDELTRLVSARMDIDLAAASHEEVKRNIDDLLNKIQQIQNQRGQLQQQGVYRSNHRTQSVIAFGTVGSLVVAVVAVVVSLLSRCH